MLRKKCEKVTDPSCAGKGLASRPADANDVKKVVREQRNILPDSISASLTEVSERMVLASLDNRCSSQLPAGYSKPGIYIDSVGQLWLPCWALPELFPLYRMIWEILESRPFRDVFHVMIRNTQTFSRQNSYCSFCTVWDVFIALRLPLMTVY